MKLTFEKVIGKRVISYEKNGDKKQMLVVTLGTPIKEDIGEGIAAREIRVYGNQDIYPDACQVKINDMVYPIFENNYFQGFVEKGKL